MSRRRSDDGFNNKIHSAQSILWNKRSKKASLDSLRNRGSIRRSMRSFSRKKVYSGQAVAEDSVIPDFPKFSRPGPLDRLPDEFLDWAESPVMLPHIIATPSTEIYGFLAKTFGINDYEFNSLSFAFIDRIRQMLLIAQENMRLSERSQKFFVAWYAHIIYLIKANKWKVDEAYEEICTRFRISINEQDILELGIPIPFHLADGRELNGKQHLDFYHPDQSESKNIGILLHKIFGNRFRMLLSRNTVCGDYEVDCTHLKVQFPKQYKPLEPSSKQKVDKVPPKKKDEKVEKSEAKRVKKSDDDEEFLTIHNYDETSDVNLKKEHKERAPNVSGQASKKGSTAGSGVSFGDEEVPELTMEEKLLFDAQMRVKYKYILPLIDATDEEYFKNLFPVKPPEPKKKGKDKKK